EAVLVRGTRGRFHAGVIGQGGNALADEPLRSLLDLAARQAIHDARLAGVLVTDEAQQLRARVVLVDDRVADVRAVEARNEDPRIAKREAFDDLGSRLRVGRGS